MKLIQVLLLASSLALAGCGWFSRFDATVTGHSVECIDGVRYLQFPSGATPKYTRDGRLETCR